ncbi:MAG: dihydroorotate dehydrogenase electron transfer subunit [Lachnospiraceae bacterium]|nr:dihydroorotate dehydrogenase electron transfer subunit [Lachnospiraceae bacterium]
MKQYFEIKKNELIAADVYRMVLSGDTSDITMPGQFINILLDGFFLRRPISVCDWKDGELTLIYKVVGKGTAYMSTLKNGIKLDILSGLGNGFDVSEAGDTPLLVGGGVGTPPMYGLAKRLVLAGKSVNVVLGFASAADSFYTEDFDELNELYDFGCEGFESGMTRRGFLGEKTGANQNTVKYPEVRVYTATVDGSLGTKGFVTDCLGNIENCSHYYACGPIPMLKALKTAMNERFAGVNGELSLEERMGCGFGACVGCSVETLKGARKVCSDGPVFAAEELLF